MTLVARTRDGPAPLVLIDAIRSTIRDVHPDQAVFGIKRMERVVAESLSGFTLSLSILAALVPARRASRVDPMAVLRSD